MILQDDPAARARFLYILAEVGNLDSALEMAGLGISRNDVLMLKGHDSRFAAEYDEAMHRFYALLEREALRRAVEGVPVPQFYRGQIVDSESVRKFSDKILILLLQRHIPEYRQRVTVEQTNNNGFHPDITEQMEALEPDERKALRAILEKLESNRS